MVRLGILGLFLLISLMGCQSPPVSETSSARDVTAGSILTLHQRLVIEPNSARVYLQHGKIVSANEVSRFYPNCWFELNTVSDKQQFLAPGNYRVNGIKHYRRPFGLGGVEQGILVAGSTVAGVFDRSREIEFITEMTLTLDTQSDIRRFMCKITADPLGRYLTFEDIRAALGSVVTIEPAGLGPP